MSYRPKKDVIASIGERKRMRGGIEYTVYDAYLGYDPYSKKQKRMQATSRAELEEQVERFYIEHRTAGDAAARLKPHEALDAREAIDTLAAHNERISLTEVVKRYLGGSTASKKSSCVSIGEARDKFMSSQVGKSKVYIKSLKNHIGAFVGDFGPQRFVSEVTAKAVTESLRRRLLDENDAKTWKTYNNHLGDIKTFFGWCCKSEQGYLAANPIMDVKKIVMPYKDPEYLRADKCAALFAYMEKNVGDFATDLADAILSFFCGMRQDEIKRVRLGRAAVVIDLDERFIRVIAVKGATKGIQPRVFTIPETAYAWMRSFDFMAAVMKKNNKFRVHLKKIADAAGVKEMPENCGRHTFCTMFDAVHHDQAKLSAIVGNSEAVRKKHYNGIATEKEGKAYFAILPGQKS